MALILRIDVDRPYGKEGAGRHILSYLGSEYYCPRIERFGYLDELKRMLRMLNERARTAHVCFRRCTLPSPEVLDLMDRGGHAYALHLENSRTFESFHRELARLRAYLGREVIAFSKHGSGKTRYGWHHYAPYEPEKYVGWARRAGLRTFFGNLEDPRLEPEVDGVVYFPSAFWLEPDWRDTDRFPIPWLLAEARRRDVVMLCHPDNVLSDRGICAEFLKVVDALETKRVA